MTSSRPPAPDGEPDLARRAAAELLGTGLLVTAVIGSGIAASRLSTDEGLRLLENAVATAAALAAIIVAFGAVSGAHLNPVVTMVDAALGGIFELSSTVRTGGGLWLAEVVATAGLLFVVVGSTRGSRASATPFVVGAYIGAAYFFTSSTSFANPAITIGRMFSDTFAGIAPASVLPFIGAQLLGATLGIAAVRFLFPVAAPEPAVAVG